MGQKLEDWIDRDLYDSLAASSNKDTGSQMRLALVILKYVKTEDTELLEAALTLLENVEKTIAL